MSIPSSGGRYRMTALDGLVVGNTITLIADGGRGISSSIAPGWHLPAGLYTPRQIVEGCAPLLETVLHNLGRDPPNTVPARRMLLDNLASNLAIDTRESTLQIPDPKRDTSRDEIARQAVEIGKTLVQYANEIKHPDFDPHLNIRSPCEGHLLNQDAVGLMFGPRSQMHLMQIFNEYLHQMVLLRDALLPFENYTEVLIPVDGKTTRGQIGMRWMEVSRSQFLTQFMTRSISQDMISSMARALLIPELVAEGGYAFQYQHGLILPAFLAGSSSLRLLHYLPVRLDDSINNLIFDYEHQEYYAASRVEIPKSVTEMAANSWPPPPLPGVQVGERSLELEMSPEETSSARRVLKLRLEFERDHCATVDLGQISRGRRYAYGVGDDDDASETANGGMNGTTTGFSIPSTVHDPVTVLTNSGAGLITSTNRGIRLIPTKDPIVALALLGKIYPENIIVLDSQHSPREAEGIGKSFDKSPRFIIYGDKLDILPKRG
ncbi:MAG: hypothetical protein M1816_000399 [Peltula sp. TS41687]|nr:MAG: hypothetical protein M1816_000399 [Peltula sp. TS41687]